MSDPTWRHIWRRIHFKSHQNLVSKLVFGNVNTLKESRKSRSDEISIFQDVQSVCFLGIQNMTCQPNLGLQKAVADTGGEQNNQAKTHWFLGSGPHLEGVLQNITPFTTFSVRSLPMVGNLRTFFSPSSPLGGSSQDGCKWLGSPQSISHKVRPFGRGPTTRSLGDENDHYDY